jgi:uncharacterized membrane protein
MSSIVIIWAITYAPWKQLWQKNIRFHLFTGAIIALGLFWSFVGVNVHELYKLHLSLITTVTFIFGIYIGVVIGALALVFSHISTPLPLENIGFHFLTGVATPAMITQLMLIVIGKMRIQNVFVYTLGGSFLGGMLAAIGIGATSIFLLWLTGSTMLWPVWDNKYLFLLLTFPEGFCNGAIISTITILRPDLVKTYNDDFYLDGK